MTNGALMNNENLSNTVLRKEIILLAIPAIGEMILHMAVGVSDVAFVVYINFMFYHVALLFFEQRSHLDKT